VVTALFCDVTGSTALGEELDPEVLRAVLNRYFEVMRGVIERHGGTVEKFIGDAVMAVFGIPVVHEDDALRAVRTAAEIRERLPAVGEEVGVQLRFRTGINTGPVLMGEGENLVVGDAVNVAARFEQAAQPGEIVLGEETLVLVRDAVEVEALQPLALKGKSEPVAAFRLMSVDLGAPGVARQLDTPLVGRDHELRVVREAWGRVVRESGCHLFTLLGAAGVGKSRLIAELLAGIGDQASVLRGRCLHYGEGITFWPLVEALMPVGAAAEQVLEGLNGGGAATAEELFWEVRRLLESLAAKRPVLLYIDDLQWAEPMLLDLLDHVADLSRGFPILLLCTARPELLEGRPAWGGGKLNATTASLEPLDGEACERLLEQLGDGLAREARERVIAASQGNPLFLEEMVAFAEQRGTISVPATIQALLAARLEALAVEERELLERGAVEGEVFHRLAVRALTDGLLSAELERWLASLVRKDLIRPDSPTFGKDEAFRFRHLLIRDAAYEGLPKAVRAELHERFARWLESVAVDLPELDEIAGWHLEQAVIYRGELGQKVDAPLTLSAAGHLHTAGQRAMRRDDPAAADKLLERAFALVPEDVSLRAQVAADLAAQMLDRGSMDRVDELLLIAERDPATAGAARPVRLRWVMATNPEEGLTAIKSVLPGMVSELARVGDEEGLANAHMSGWELYWMQSRATPAADQARLAAECARNADDHGLRSLALGKYVHALCMGPTPATKLAAELSWIKREARGPLLEGFVAVGWAFVERLSGDFDLALEHAMHAVELLEALQSSEARVARALIADIHILAGTPEAALPGLGGLDDSFAERGRRDLRSTVQAVKAQVYVAMGDRESALSAIELSDRLSASDDVINFAITHALRSRLAIAEGDLAGAERWAQSAVQHAFMTDFVSYQAAGKLQLAKTLGEMKRWDEARIEARAALAGYEAKEDRPETAEAQAFLDTL
ncbi:MAG: AAA family ATPase, partial [Solirubrobacteraceae bacterium]